MSFKRHEQLYFELPVLFSRSSSWSLTSGRRDSRDVIKQNFFVVEISGLGWTTYCLVIIKARSHTQVGVLNFHDRIYRQHIYFGYWLTLNFKNEEQQLKWHCSAANRKRFLLVELRLSVLCGNKCNQHVGCLQNWHVQHFRLGLLSHFCANFNFYKPYQGPSRGEWKPLVSVILRHATD